MHQCTDAPSERSNLRCPCMGPQINQRFFPHDPCPPSRNAISSKMPNPGPSARKTRPVKKVRALGTPWKKAPERKTLSASQRHSGFIRLLVSAGTAPALSHTPPKGTVGDLQPLTLLMKKMKTGVYDTWCRIRPIYLACCPQDFPNRHLQPFCRPRKVELRHFCCARLL